MLFLRFSLSVNVSAVDPAVARHLFEKCIRGALRDKIVVLSTHQLQFVEKVRSTESLPSITLHRRTTFWCCGRMAA